MHFTQHVPGFIDTDEPRTEFDFATTEELLAHEGVARWAKPWSDSDGMFRRFSKSLASAPKLLLAEFAGGIYYVVGYLQGSPEELAALDLPVWDKPKEDA